ncbi:hypothetical protein ACH5RR_015653 [Cinchona calisaya]|uniref:Uncharacterized protein n=1 Tax=Cinchona calisaya TaxID=153742 RepID=A0ABD2ZTS6_9GENT
MLHACLLILCVTKIAPKKKKSKKKAAASACHDCHSSGSSSSSSPASPPGSPTSSDSSPSPPASPRAAAAAPPPGPPALRSDQQVCHDHRPQPPRRRHRPARNAYLNGLDEMSRIPGLRDFEVSNSRTYRWNFRDSSMNDNYYYHHGPSNRHIGPPPGPPPYSPSSPESSPPQSYHSLPRTNFALPPPPAPYPCETFFSDEDPNGCKII